MATWLANRLVSSIAWAPTKSDPHLQPLARLTYLGALAQLWILTCSSRSGRSLARAVQLLAPWLCSFLVEADALAIAPPAAATTCFRVIDGSWRSNPLRRLLRLPCPRPLRSPCTAPHGPVHPRRHSNDRLSRRSTAPLREVRGSPAGVCVIS